MTVRVLRLLEYVYPDHRTAEEDMSRWGLAANGTRVTSPNGYIASATIPPRTLRDDEPVPSCVGPVELRRSQGVGTNETVNQIIDTATGREIGVKQLIDRYNKLTGG